MDEEPLSGQESSILAYFAQYPNGPKRDREKLLGQLKGRALLVARALIGIDQRPSKKTREIVKELKAWADGVKEQCRTLKMQRETQQTARGLHQKQSNSSNRSSKKTRKS